MNTPTNQTSTQKLGPLAMIFVLLGTLGLLYFGAVAPDTLATWLPFKLVDNAFVDAKLKYQIVTFVMALAILAITYGLAPRNARRFYRPGNPSAPAEPIGWLGIKPTDTWKTVGTSFMVIVSLATGAFVFFNIAQGQSLEAGNLRFLPFILVLAAMNAFTEEAITRLSVVTALDGTIRRPAIYIISALVFGIPPTSGYRAGSWVL